MNVKVFPLGLLQANCYLVFDDRQCFVIDPGSAAPKDLERLYAFIETQNLTVTAILLTHAHFDHIEGVDALVNRFSCPVYIHECDHPALSSADINLSASLLRRRLCVCADVTPLKDGETIVSAPELSFELLHTPGHSSGSSCYIIGDMLFTGDTLFEGSVGRTDFPGGSFEVLMSSLERIKNYFGERDITVYPGHGAQTTLKHEISTNIYYSRG